MPDATSTIAVRKSLVVEAPCPHAFDVFANGFNTWWPRDHHIGKSELRIATIEPRAGGRWFETCVDGSECDWGRVLVYEPPTRLVLAWHLNGHWAFDPDSAHASEVEVRFIAEGPARTRVELEHRHLERAAFADELRTGVDSPQGWSGLLALFAEKAHETRIP